VAEVVIDEENARRHRRRQLIEWGVVILAAFIAAAVLRATVVQAFSIPSVSMEETLLVGDRVLVNKQNRDANVGDVVVFHRPPGQEAATIKDLIKRVVAVEGQTVSGRENQLFVDGEAIDEKYRAPNSPMDDFGPVEIKRGYVFVMGDNRRHSADSRVFGPIKKSSIIGHAYFRVWPIGRFGGI
jgi:signal peptidase I